MHFTHRTSQNGGVLSVGKSLSAVDKPMSRDDPVRRSVDFIHAEPRRSGFYEHVVFYKGAGIKQQVDSLARRQLALDVLPVNFFLSALKQNMRLFIEHGLKLLIHTTIPP